MPRKRQIPVLLDEDQLAEIDALREARRVGSIRTPYAVIIREALAEGLPKLTARASLPRRSA